MGSREKNYTREQRQAIDEERVRIARDLHDGPIQIITHISHKLELMQHLLEKQAKDRALDELQKMRTILNTCLHTLRHDIASLMSTSIAMQDIDSTLRNLIDDFKMSEPAVQLTCTIDTLDQLSPTLAEPLFHFVQESLNNVRKHARATDVTLCVLISPTQLIVEVCDNGIGIQPKPDDRGIHKHMGLCILHERVQEVEGTVTIQDANGNGTCIKAVFPLMHSINT